MDNGFIDLRDGDGQGADSFWPSFTDIMMVVLMIFMIASTVLMLRNWELVRELRTTIQSEREAEALALSATRTSATLEERLAQAQHELSVMRMQLLQAGEARTDLSDTLATTRRELAEQRSDRERLSIRLQQFEQERTRSATRLQDSQQEARRLAAARDALSTDLEALEQRYAEEVTALREQADLSTTELEELRVTYADLQTKYDKLVRPARTAAGKRVVSVRYRQVDDLYILEYKPSEKDGYRLITREGLDSELVALKKQVGSKLYVKVVIPEDSGLSYNEAWTFTQDILTTYDYYYQ